MCESFTEDQEQERQLVSLYMAYIIYINQLKLTKSLRNKTQ